MLGHRIHEADKFAKRRHWLWPDAESMGWFRKITKPCSCYMCGNPRRQKLFNPKDRITQQEKRADISFEEQVNEHSQ